MCDPEYNLDENWGFYVDIENMKTVTLNTEKNTEKNKTYDYSIKGYDTEIFCMDEDIENETINKTRSIFCPVIVFSNLNNSNFCLSF